MDAFRDTWRGGRDHSSIPEGNGFVTSASRHIFDEMGRMEMELGTRKPVDMLAATLGRRAGANVVADQRMRAPHFGADLRGMSCECG